MDLVGRVVTSKLRGTGILKGVIESYDTATGFVKITYEDGDSEELDLVEATSLVQSVPEKDKVIMKPARKPKKRRWIRDDPGKDFDISVENNHLQSAEDSAAEIALSPYDGVIASIDAQKNSCFRASIDLNLSAFNDIDEGVGSVEKGGEVEKRERAFDLNQVFDEENVDLETEQVEQLVDVSVEMLENKNSCSLDIVEKVDVESVCFNVASDDGISAQCITGESCLASVGGGKDEQVSVLGNPSDLTCAAHVNRNTTESHLIESYQEVGALVLCEDEIQGRRKKRKLTSTLHSPEVGSLRRSARRAKAKAFAQYNESSNEDAHGTNDISSSAISVVSEEEKPDLCDTEGGEVSEVLPSPVALPPSSKILNLEGIPVLDLFSVYSCLRSFSALLYLSPFKLEDFVVSLKSNIASTLLDSVHVAILQTLRKHLKFLSDGGSEPASTCLRNLNWDLLDVITWPIFLAEYLLLHDSGTKPCFNGSLKLVDGDYYKKPAGVKIAILQCLCDDVIEVDCIQAELNRRILASDFGPDFDKNSYNASSRKTRASIGFAENPLLDESVAVDTNDWNSDECCLCKMEGNLVCCDGCPAAYHSRCVGIASNLLPDGDWYCPECVNNRFNPEITPQKLIRGAELLGADPYGRIYFHCCGYLLVSESFDAESSFSYYHKDEIRTVINVLESSGFSCGSITRAISKSLMVDAELNEQKTCMGFPSALIQAVCKPTECSILSYGEEGNVRKSERLGNPVTSSEGPAEVLQGCEPIQSCNRTSGVSSSVSETAELNSVHVAVDTTPVRRKRGRPPGVQRKLSAKKAQVDEAPPVQDGTLYVNYYSFAQIASSIAEDITHKPSDRVNETLMKSEEEIMSTQLKTISKKSVKFCWPSFKDIHSEMQKEKCGWCYSCKSPDEDRDCLFNVNTTSSISEGLKAELGVFQSKHNKKDHLADLICYILSMEHRLRGLLLGPFLRSDDSQIFLKNVLKAPDFALVKHRLLWLESNLRPSALSADWVKHVDSALTMGSASHVVIRTRVSSKFRIGRKRNIFGCDPTPVSANGGLVMLWWRGGQVSRKLFNWKVLPRSLASKAARKGGCMKIPGLLYPDSSEHVKRSNQIAWRAAVEMSTSVAQLALQVRELDLKTRWDEIENTYILSTLDKETQKSVKLFKKVVVRRKCVEGTMVKYLLDFGKRRLIPDVVLRHGSKVDDPTSDRKKYWLEESYLPLHLLRNFEEKSIARKAGKLASSKAHQGDKALSKSIKRKDFEYLFARAEKSNYYLCGHCKKDVPISEAVSCRLCKGYFHKRHVRKPSVAVAKKCTYTCHKCEAGKRINVIKKKARVKLQKLKPKNGMESGSLTSKVKSKRGRKPKVEQRQILLRNSKRVQVSDHPPKASTKANVYAGVALRRSARKAKSAPVQFNDVANGGKRKRQSISQNRDEKKPQTKPLCKKNRTKPLHAIWRNGLHLSKKPDDERAVDFKKRNLLIPSKCSDEDEIAAQLKCRLCDEEGYTAGSKYIACEKCGDWYHGDAFDLDTEIIKSLIGFRCHVCLEKSPPVCPYLDDTRSCEPLSVQAANNAGTEMASSLLEVILDPNETNLVQSLED
ncbi:hypothetical protein V2J09_018524 [Rumex salicifolius]